MNNKFKVISGLLALSFATSHAVTFSGTAAQGILGENGAALSAGQRAILVVDTGSNGFSSVNLGDDLSVGSTLGSDDFIFGTAVTQDLGFTSVAGFTSVVFNLGENGIADGQNFALYIFDGVTGTTASTGFFGIGTDASFTIPGSNSATFDFNATADSDSFQQLSGLQASTAIAVPEPSAYAALAGLFTLGWVMVRRRR